MSSPRLLRDEELDALVITARAGDRTAFERLWRELSGPVASYARSRGVQDVDDVVSATFLAAFQGLPTFQGSGSRFRAWLFTIAHHKIIDTLRSHARRSVEGPLDDTVPVASTASAEEHVMDALSNAQVRTLLATLTPDQRDVLLLRIVADLPIAEVSAVLGRTQGAVKQLQHRALAQLRKQLGPQPPTPGPMRPVTSTSTCPITQVS